MPTLQDFREELLKQDEPEAQEIALAIELFTSGSLNTFAKHTNVDTNNRLICYDILDLGKQLMPIGMLVVLDSILNRITQNRAKGRNTFIFIDEIYLLFQHEYSANFLFTLWKRVRKYGAYATGITQNVDDLLPVSYTHLDVYKRQHGGSLPIPVHFLMDEFANVSLPDDFDKILSLSLIHI